MTVKKIVRNWLVEHGYHGLYDPGGDCDCQECDLFPCSHAGYLEEDDSDDWPGRCKPGYEHITEHGWVIKPDKPKKTLGPVVNICDKCGKVDVYDGDGHSCEDEIVKRMNRGDDY